jgi:1-acyl-sn-glycerol-3-phosphate acyltransferase
MALWWFRSTGWKIQGRLPPESKFVAVGAPHTTNWDFVVMVAVMAFFGVKISFMGKDSLFKGPVGFMMRRLGGIPIRRSIRESVVEQMADAFAKAEALVLVIAPSGTRRRSDHWKSGFYHIARTAGVPIVPAGINYPEKLVTVGPPLVPSGDLTADMDVFRRFYSGSVGKYPDQSSDIRLVEEEPTPGGPTQRDK